MADESNRPTNVIEPEPDEDLDSALGTDDTSYTTSLRSSLLQSVVENGRAYHKYRDGIYPLPDDEQEQERLDMQHEMFIKTLGGKLLLAPIPDQIERVLDIGTGTGIWAVDFADQHPEAQIIGTDLSAIQPSLIPPNCKFEVDDFEQTWTYSHKFDLIHGRMLMGSVNDVPKLFKQIHDHLKPGGWFEIQDMTMPTSDDGTSKGTAWERCCENMRQALLKIGRDTLVGEKYKTVMQDVGLVNVVEVDYKWPQNPWPKDKALKELGKWNMINTLDGLWGFVARAFTHILGMSTEEVQVLLVEARKDIQDRKIHSYWPVKVVYGQKPTEQHRLSADE